MTGIQESENVYKYKLTIENNRLSTFIGLTIFDFKIIFALKK